jgi:hypothetical protein
MRFRLLIATAALVALHTAPALAGPANWTGLIGLNDAQGPSWVREYATGTVPTTLYAATEGDGVWKSTNDGVSWTDFSSGLENYPGAKDVRTVYTSGASVYAGTDAGLFANAGGGWQPVAQGPEDDPKHPKKLNAAVQAVLKPLAGPMLAGVASGGVYLSNDGGATWTPPAPGNGMSKSETVWSFAQLIPGSVFAATSSGIYRSLDGGATWTLKSDGITGITLRVVADSTRPNIFYAITPDDGVFRSINFGETWANVSAGLGNDHTRALQKFSGVNETRLYVGTEDGVWAGTTGNGLLPGPVHWRKVENTGLGNNTIFWALTNFLTTPGTLLGGTQSNGGYAYTFVPPSNTVAPAITGTATVGKTLSVLSNGTWNGSKTIEFSYQWQRCTSASAASCTVDIPDATQPSYVLTQDDKGKWLRVVITGENDFPTFGQVKANSNLLGAVAANPANLPGANQSSIASISGPGLPQSGNTLTAQGWLFNPAATVSTRFVWLRCDANGNDCHPIPGASSQTYKLTDQDVTLRLRVQVTGTNADGSTTLDPSGPTNTIFPEQATQTKPATMTGNAWVGESLVSGVGAWKYPGTTYTRQWERCEADGSSCSTLSGEKGAAHLLGADDLGHRLRVRVSADSNGPNTFPGPVEVFTPLSDVVTLPPVPAPPGGGGGGGGGGAVPVAADTVAPVFTSLSIAKTVKRGKPLTFKSGLSEGGKLSVRLERLVPGHRKGKVCKAGGKHGKKCTAVKPAGTFTLATGTASLKAKLAAGAYRAVVTPVDAAGNRGASRTLTFKVTRR